MKKSKILIVDDNESILSALELLLEGRCASLQTVSNPKMIPTMLHHEAFDVVLLDMNFSAGINSGSEGLFWLKEILKHDEHIAVVMMTAYGDIELAVKAVKNGAFDFILKPWDNHKILTTIKAATELRATKKELHALKDKEKSLKQTDNMGAFELIGSSPAFVKMLKLIHKVAQTDANVLITGENGTGKELVARALHQASARKEEIMLGVDMGALSENLFESELFGYVKGAFTDAHDDRMGKFETANGGTLFMDEIANIPLSLQAKLLATLQNREVMRLGSNKKIPIDIRLICATNAQLDELVLQGKFREDLLYRINTIHIEIPPLRKRQEDILLLAQHFMQRYAKKYNKTLLSIEDNLKKKMLAYHWPGNVRELQHSIEKAVILCEDNTLTEQDILFPHRNIQKQQVAKTLDEMEMNMIRACIEEHDGNMSAVANQLGISRQTLYNKLKKYNL